jgi:CAAX prenyl protease-like protein
MSHSPAGVVSRAPRSPLSDLIGDSTRSYWLPFFAFAACTALEGYLPIGLYPWAYVAKVVAITILLLVDGGVLRAIRPSSRVVIPAVAVGLVVFAQWIVLDKVIPYPSLGSRIGFNPLTAFSSDMSLAIFLCVRMFGLIALVPVIEEAFWRGFAIRYFTNENFEAVPVGVFSMSAFWIVTIGNAATHPEWLVALIAFAIYAWLLKSTRSLFAVILAHAVTNAALGAYILLTHDWHYW